VQQGFKLDLASERIDSFKSNADKMGSKITIPSLMVFALLDVYADFLKCLFSRRYHFIYLIGILNNNSQPDNVAQLEKILKRDLLTFLAHLPRYFRRLLNSSALSGVPPVDAARL